MDENTKPARDLSAMAVRPDLDCNEVSGISLTSAFNKNLFHLECHRVQYESTQAVPVHHCGQIRQHGVVLSLPQGHC